LWKEPLVKTPRSHYKDDKANFSHARIRDEELALGDLIDPGQTRGPVADKII